MGLSHFTPKTVLCVVFNMALLQCSSTADTVAPSTCPSSACPSPAPPAPPENLPYDPESFSVLKLNVEALYGSRWAIDQKKLIGISHSIDIMDASLIHTNQLSLHVEFNLRQSWSAPGLELPEGLFKDEDPPGTFVSAGGDVLKYMWSPDSYISTSRESNMNIVGAPLTLVYIFKNRTIIFKARMFTKVGCSSSFQWYPLDIQHCDLVIESYKYQDDIVRYYWTQPQLYRPVVIEIGRLFQYELQLPLYHDNGTKKRGGRGTRYPFVRLRFNFERKLGNNLIQVYTPTILVVVLSWFSFWLGLDAIPGRISLLVTCMLTLVTMHSGIKSSIPPVHYITMMDLWMVVCMGTVFGAMCEFIVVKYAHWRHEQQKDKRAAHSSHQGATFNNNNQSTPNHLLPPEQQVKELSSNVVKSCMTPVEMLRTVLVVESGGQPTQKSEEGGDTNNAPYHPVPVTAVSRLRLAPLWIAIDKFCRFFFPFLFCIFNAIYWPVLLQGSEIQRPQPQSK